MIREDKDIRFTNTIGEIVDCVHLKKYNEVPEKLISMFNSLPKDQINDYFRILAVPFLFHKTEYIFKSSEEPDSLFEKTLVDLKDSTITAVNNEGLLNILSNSFENFEEEDFQLDVKTHTGQHYGNLFKEFKNVNYFEEAKKLLETRLIRNEVNIPNLKDSVLLDQGCGGGRYTTAWKLLGVNKAVGIDFSEIGLSDARSRVEIAGINNIDFIKGSVLNMPFEDEIFDIVYSNGVLHHTEDWKKGIKEQLRVMKSGGFGWQYLIENPGGIFWDNIEILRAILKDVNKKFAQNVLRSLGIPMNRVFYMLDHVMVPINTRLSSNKIIEELKKNGACNIRRLDRGTNFDRVESIYNKIPFAKKKFGIGENRFVFNKI
ncbi:class I SAM-dependent methyltransferase [Gillisia sp. JM1]|uniref:class I SAM-dependent methyltransferase n=1 Tax=Gillisia sp. JM1 TaxID=1283286 RepID=UPI00041203CE|nr:class I SAM-dependent methyltransferase [Gillisia sp. JM1]